jgi:hypothetical protein
MKKKKMQAAGVGSEIGAGIGQWIEDNLLAWLGFAMGGELADYSAAERKDLLKQAKADLKADIASGDFVVPASARGGMQAAGVGSEVGQKIEDWIVNWWNSLARGGQVMAAKKGHSVFR